MAASEEDIKAPHGVQQQIKMELLKMIDSAENPFDIIYHLASYLEKESREAGYAKYVTDQLRAVYGFALQDEKLIQDEIADVEARCAIIERAQSNPDFTEEERNRIGFAVNLHKKNIERLKELASKAKANHTSEYIHKNPPVEN